MAHNSLIHETSPYLLQHAYNPVDWFPWGEVAIAKAKKENKPILLSIGYSACHWCHVMEKESFENEATAALMNNNFINIKVDREERPDIDHIYMDALQAMTGSGGWPLNIFLTPDLKPFYGGTYFPPIKSYNRNSWNDVLNSINKAWTEKNNELIAQSETLTDHLIKSNKIGENEIDVNNFTIENLKQIADKLRKNMDWENGGFGAAPKFPQFQIINYLLQQYYFFKNENDLNAAIISLQKMIEGGIYDQLKGSLARYSTDVNWLVPHFEKMLYDNALFVQTLSTAFLITKNEIFENAITETINFLQKDLMHSNHLFYAAIDADSEGVEGKYYCWTLQEIIQILSSKEAEILAKYYDVTDEGNFTEPHHHITTNILHINCTIDELQNEFKISKEEVESILQNAKQKLLIEREKRIPPITDDKCLLSWNALANKALVAAYTATLNKNYLYLALKNMDSIIKLFLVFNEKNEIEKCYHSWKNEQSTINAFLDDIAFLADAFLAIYNVTLNEKYKHLFYQLIQFAELHFSDENSPFYFYTQKEQANIIVRKKELYDGATPSANAVMATILIDASLLFEEKNWAAKSRKMLQHLANALLKFPQSFAYFSLLLHKNIFGVNEITINQEKIKEIIKGKIFIPNKLICNVKNKKFKGFMLCKKETCQQEVQNFDEILTQIQVQDAMLWH